MAKKKKGLDLEGMDLSKYGVSRNTTEVSNENKNTQEVSSSIATKVETTVVETKGIRAVKNIEIKRKLIAFPKHYEDAILKHIEENSTPIKKMTVQDFFLEAVEEKLVSLGY